MDSLRPLVVFISTLTRSVSCLPEVRFEVFLLAADAFVLLLLVLGGEDLLGAAAALLSAGGALLADALALLGGTLAVFADFVCAAASAAERAGRADGRSDVRFAGGREVLELPDPDAFFAFFCAATLRAGGAEDRRLVLCLVAVTGPRAFLGGAFDAREDFGVLLVGIFTSSHRSRSDVRACPAPGAVESM